MAITIKDLEQYRQLQKEVAALSERLERLANTPDVGVFDTVKGSSYDVRNVERVFTIMGMGGKHRVTYEKVASLLRERYDRIQQMIVTITEFINAIPDSHIRQIVEYRYIQGLSWRKTAKKLDLYTSPDSARMALNRYMQKNIVIFLCLLTYKLLFLISLYAGGMWLSTKSAVTE